MNVKRYLKKQARKDQQAIMDADNGQTLCALGIDYPAPKQKNRRTMGWLLGAASVAVSSILIVCIVMFYPTQQSQTIYWDINFENRASTLSEMNSELHDFAFEVDESVYSIRLARTSDSVSKDLLYYTISLNSYDSLVKMQLISVCNPKFEFQNFKFLQTPTSKSLPLYNVLYEFETRPDPQFDLEWLSCTAEIDGKQDIVYVKQYEELLVQPEPAFFDIIQTIVKPVK